MKLVARVKAPQPDTISSFIVIVQGFSNKVQNWLIENSDFFVNIRISAIWRLPKNSV